MADTAPVRAPESANQILGVQYFEAMDHAARALPVLQPALDRDDAYSAQDVLNHVIMRDMQMWLVNDYQAVVITRIPIYPKYKALQVCWLAGDGVDEWFEDLMDVLENYAHSMGCRHVEVYGRRGWKKYGDPRGYEETMVVLRKMIQ